MKEKVEYLISISTISFETIAEQLGITKIKLKKKLNEIHGNKFSKQEVKMLSDIFSVKEKWFYEN